MPPSPHVREPGSDDDDTPAMDLAELRREEAEHDIATRVQAERNTAADDDFSDEPEPPAPLDRPTLPCFPVDALPSQLREFVSAIAEAVQVPVDLPALLALAAVAACVQRRHVVEVCDDYREPLSLFALVVLGSGERKSACVQAVTKPIADWERSEARKRAQPNAEEQSRRATATKRKEHLETLAAKKHDPALATEAAQIARELATLPEPVFPRILADDTTPEALGRLMAEHAERMSVFSAEGGIFETIAGRYSSGTPNLDVFLKGHAGDLLRIDRRGGPPVVMDAPALTMGLAVQPDVLHAMADKPGFRGRGLLARFLYAVPASRVGYRRVSAAPVPPHVVQAYEARIRQLLDALARENGEPTRICLSPDALAARHALAERLETRMRPGADLAHIKDWAGKAAGLAVRLAGIMHLASGSAGAIGEATMQAAVRVVEEYALPHALAAFGEMVADPELDAARAVVEWVRARGLSEVSVRDVHVGLRGQARFARVDAIRRAVELAEQHGHFRRRPDPPGTGSGRPPSPRYAVMPLDARIPPQNPQNPRNADEVVGSVDSVDFVDGPEGHPVGAPTHTTPRSP
jgi:replicative DNA helicase